MPKPRPSVFVRALTIVGVLCLAAPCGAQQNSPLPIGVRVRLDLRDSLRQGPLSRRRQIVVGTVLRSAPDQLTLTLGPADTAHIHRPLVRSVAISRGASRTRSALALATVGVVVGFAMTQSRDEKIAGVNPRLAGIGFGVGLGALLGGVSPYEHWRRVRW